MGLFPFLQTLAACLVCLTGAAMHAEGPREAVDPLAALLLAGLLLEEGWIRRARRKGSTGRKAVERVQHLFYGFYPPAAFAVAVACFRLDGLPSLLGTAAGGFTEKGMLFLLYLVLSNLNRLQRERHLRAAFHLPRRAGAFRLRTGLRTEFTVGILFFFFVLGGDLLEAWPQAARLLDALPLLSWAVLLAALGGVSWFLPRFVKVVWRLRRLRAEPLRSTLLGFMEARKFGVRDLLVWDTQRLVMNAAILGLRPRSRYIVFTDLMVEGFSPAELTAVLSHEVGHGKHRHLSTYFLLSLSFLFFLTLADNFHPPFAGTMEEVTWTLTIVLPGFVLYLVLVLGYLSRRFETEADIYGVAAIGDPELFIRALEQVAAVSGMDRTRRSWRHFSVDRRVRLLRRFFIDDPTSLDRFRGRMNRIRKGLLLFFLCAAVLFTLDGSLKTAAGVALLSMDGEDPAATAARVEATCAFPGLGPSRWVLVPLLLRARQADRAAARLKSLAEALHGDAAPEGVRKLVIQVHRAFRERGEEEKAAAWLRWTARTFPRDPVLAGYARLSRLPFTPLFQAFEGEAKNEGPAVGEDAGAKPPAPGPLPGPKEP